MLRRLLFACAMIAVPADAAPRFGVSLSGLEASSGGALGYSHIAPTAADISLGISSGATLFRIPFRAYRVQPTIGGPLAANEVAAIKVTVDRVLSAPDTIVILDEHDFGSSYGLAFGTPPWTPSAIAMHWSKLLKALGYLNSNRVFIGLQNEPKAAGAKWWTVAQATVDALRASHVDNPVSIDGSGYSAAYNWATVNGPEAAKFSDPAHHVFFEPHVYFDADDSGTHDNCVAGSETRVDSAIKDATSHGYKIIFGEISFGADQSCDAVRKAVISKLKAAPNIFGVTFWTLGNFALYPKYMFGLSGPVKGQASTLMTSILNDWNRRR